MFCPQCAHEQISNDTRFCSRCGFSLSLVSELLDKSSSQLQREKREITGISLTMATVIMLFNFVIVFGTVTLPHLANPVFLWIWSFFVLTSLIIGGLGLTNLIRGGFFKRLKERETRLHLMKSAPEHQPSPEESKTASLEAGTMPRLFEQVSVTETTTRELQEIPGRTAEPFQDSPGDSVP